MADLACRVNYVNLIEVPEVIMQACANLFSNHYGRWTNGRPVKMNAKFLRQNYLASPINTIDRLVYAEYRGQIIGKISLRKSGRETEVSWTCFLSFI